MTSVCITDLMIFYLLSLKEVVEPDPMLLQMVEADSTRGQSLAAAQTVSIGSIGSRHRRRHQPSPVQQLGQPLYLSTTSDIYRYRIKTISLKTKTEENC